MFHLWTQISETYLVPFLGPQKVPSHMFRQHVGHQSFIPAPHFIHLLLLLMDFNLPEEKRAGQLLHL